MWCIEFFSLGYLRTSRKETRRISAFVPLAEDGLKRKTRTQDVLPRLFVALTQCRKYQFPKLPASQPCNIIPMYDTSCTEYIRKMYIKNAPLYGVCTYNDTYLIHKRGGRGHEFTTTHGVMEGVKDSRRGRWSAWRGNGRKSNADVENASIQSAIAESVIITTS